MKPRKVNGFIIKTVGIGMLNSRVVFIYDDNSLAAIVLETHTLPLSSKTKVYPKQITPLLNICKTKKAHMPRINTEYVSFFIRQSEQHFFQSSE